MIKTIVVFIIGMIVLAALSAGFLSAYEKFIGIKPNKFLVIIFNISIVIIAYLLVIEPLLSN
ncbi:hypothetical protein OAK17_00850 [Alphaproteobacteria bacterium]|nr:hypothetical protein [Alphaproteobacteria bacterium]